MNKVIMKAKNNVISQKKKYLFLSVFMLIGFITGILFIFFIAKEDKLLVKTELETFFNSIQNNEVNYLSSLVNSICSNLLQILFIWLLGISIIGIPIVIIILFMKSFVVGFGIVSIITNYNLKGILMGIVYQFPHQLLLIVVYVLLGFYAINFSIRLFKMLFFKDNVPLNQYFKQYNKILLISVITSVVASLIEVFIMPNLLNLFL